MHLRKKRRNGRARSWLVVAALAAAPASALAAKTTWTFSGNGSWTVASNWLGGTPVNGSDVFIRDNDAINRTISYDYSGASIQFNTVTVENSGTGSDAFSQSANTFNSVTEIIGNAGTGYWSLSGGTHNVTIASNTFGLYFGNLAGSKGVGTLSGGTLATANAVELVGNLGSGTFTQSSGANSANSIILANGASGIGQYNLSSGTCTVSNAFIVGFAGSGTMNMTGGSLTSPSENIGDTGISGRFIHSAGSNNVGTSLLVGTLSIGAGASVGTYLLSGSGALGVFGSESIGNGLFNQSGGTHTVGSSSAFSFLTISGTVADATYLLSDAGVLSVFGSESIGGLGAGTFNQTGGTHNVGASGSAFTSTLFVGNVGAGTYLLSGTGVLNVLGNESLSNGTFNQTGGTHNIGSALSSSTLTVGVNAVTPGSFLLSGNGALNTFGTEIIGQHSGGNGTFNQTSGRHTLGSAANPNSAIYLGFDNGSTGTYLLSGAGSLNVFGAEKAGYSGNGIFNQSGGTNNVGSSSAFSFLTISGNGGAGTYLLSGSGVLNVFGSETIGGPGAGTFNQSGGTHNVGVPGTFFTTSLFVGDGGIGNYLLSGNGVLNVSGVETVGNAGAGTFNQTGGTHLLNGTLTIGTSSGAGTYLLGGGLLAGGTLQLNSAGTFNGTSGGIVSTNFTQQGGTVAGVLRNQGAFTYLSGVFSGQLLNQGSVNLGNTFTAGNGIENDARITLGPIQTITANGMGFDNFGTLVLGGGVLTGSGPIVNDFGGVMSGHGSINGSFINNGNLTPDGALVVAGGASNGGMLNLSPANVFEVSAGLTNSAAGEIHGAGLVSATLTNSGLIFADGSLTLAVSTLLSNVPSGELRVADHSNLNVVSAFASAGLINLQGAGALLSGGAITNIGTVKGSGRISNGIQNSGILRPENGELDVFGAGNSNLAGAQIQIAAGNTLYLSQGLASNAGQIILTGGVFDNGISPLSNSGTIQGHGTMRSGAVSNSHAINLSAGATDWTGAISNLSGARVAITATGSATFYSDVSNNAGSSFTVDANSTAIFLGNVTGVSAITGAGTKYYAGTATGGPAISSGNSLVEPSGALNIDYIRENSLTVDGCATLAPDGTAAHVSRLSMLSISGTFDLADNDLIVDSTGISTIATSIHSGYNGGNWQGIGVRSSSAAASPQAHPTALGYANASSINVSSFDGQSVSGSSVLVRYTYSGDANLDGEVNALDFNALASNFGGASGRFWNQGDFNYDGTINTLDFGALAVNFNQPPLASEPLGALVPEPALAGALLGLAGWCRRCRSVRSDF